MKQNQSSEKERNSRYSPGIFAGIIIVFFLSSCCSSEPFLKSRTRINNCDCKPSKSAIAAATTSEVTKTSEGAEESLNENKIEDNGKGSVQPDEAIRGLNSEKLRVNEKKKLPFGIKAINTEVFAGVNNASPSIKTDGLSKKAGFGFSIGVGSNYYFSENFSINPMLRFRQNNFSTADADGSSDTKTNYKYSLISTPVLANFRLSPKVSLGVGPEFNYLLSATSNTTGSYYEEGEKENITDKSVRLGLGLETNIKVQLTPKLGVNLGITKGFTEVEKKYSYGYGSASEGGTLGGWFSFQFYLWFDLCRRIKADQGSNNLNFR